MAGPSETWTDIAISEWTTKTPLRASLVDAWRTNQEHLKEVAYGTSISYGGGSAHTHDGTDSSSLGLADSSNLLVHPFYSGGFWQSGVGSWSTDWSGISTGPTFGGFTFFGNGILRGQSANEYISQIIGGTATKSLGLFGSNGADVVASVWLAAKDGDSIVGEVEFGFGDGSNSPVSGTTATVSASDLTHQWRRYYARFSGAGASHATDVRFVVKVSTSFSPGKVGFVGATVNQGHNLAPPMISNLEVKGTPNSRFMWIPNAPMFEQATTLDDAVDVTP